MKAVAPSADGWGANLEVLVHSVAGEDGLDDFTGALPGTTVSMFASNPEDIEIGHDYDLVATVLGGPSGERVVIQSASRAHSGGQ